MKKLIYSLFILFLSACASSGKYSSLDKKEMMLLLSEPEAQDFHVSEMMLAIKANHLKEDFEDCHGLLPTQAEKEEVEMLYSELKVKNKLDFESKNLVALKQGPVEYYVFSINPKNIDTQVRNCQKLEQMLEQKGYKKYTHDLTR